MGDHSLSFAEEFIEGAARLRGTAKALDVWRMETKVEVLFEEVLNLGFAQMDFLFSQHFFVPSEKGNLLRKDFMNPCGQSGVPIIVDPCVSTRRGDSTGIRKKGLFRIRSLKQIQGMC